MDTRFNKENIKGLLAEIIGTMPKGCEITIIEITEHQLTWKISNLHQGSLTDYQKRWHSSMGEVYKLNTTTEALPVDKKALETKALAMGVEDTAKWIATNQKFNAQFSCAISSLAAFYEAAKNAAEDNIILIPREEHHHVIISQALILLFKIEPQQVAIYENERHRHTCIVLLNLSTFPEQRVPLKNIAVRYPHSTPSNIKEFFNNHNCTPDLATVLSNSIQLFFNDDLSTATIDLQALARPLNAHSTSSSLVQSNLEESKPVEITGKDKDLLIECFGREKKDHLDIYLYAREKQQKLCIVIRSNDITLKEKTRHAQSIEQALTQSFPALSKARETFFNERDHALTQVQLVKKTDVVLSFDHFDLKTVLKTLQQNQQKKQNEEKERVKQQISFLEELDCFAVNAVKIVNTADSVTLKVTHFASLYQDSVNRLASIVGATPTLSTSAKSKRRDYDSDTTTVIFNISPTTFLEKTKEAAEAAVVLVEAEKTLFLSDYLGIDNNCIKIYENQYKKKSCIVVQTPTIERRRIEARCAIIGLKSTSTDFFNPINRAQFTAPRFNDIVINMTYSFMALEFIAQKEIQKLPKAVQSNTSSVDDAVKLLSEITDLFIVSVKQTDTSVCCQMAGIKEKEVEAGFFRHAQQLATLPHTTTLGKLTENPQENKESKKPEEKDADEADYVALDTVDITFAVPPQTFFEAAKKDASSILQEIPPTNELITKTGEFLGISTNCIKIYYHPLASGSLGVVLSGTLTKQHEELVASYITAIKNHAFFNAYNSPQGVPIQNGDTVVYLDTYKPATLLEQLTFDLNKRKNALAIGLQPEKKRGEEEKDISDNPANPNEKKHTPRPLIDLTEQPSHSSRPASAKTELEKLKTFLNENKCQTPEILQLIDGNSSEEKNHLLNLINEANLNPSQKKDIAEIISIYIQTVINNIKTHPELLNQKEIFQKSLNDAYASYDQSMSKFKRPSWIKQHPKLWIGLLSIAGLIISAALQVLLPGIAHAAIAYAVKAGVSECVAPWIVGSTPVTTLGVFGLLTSRPLAQINKIDQTAQQLVGKVTAACKG